MEIPAEVKSIAGPTTLCLVLTRGTHAVPFICEVADIIPRDPEACQNWLAENLLNKNVECEIQNKKRGDIYTAFVFIDGMDVGAALVAQGLADDN